MLRGLDALTELNLDSNGLVELPPELQYLKNLKILRARCSTLSHNKESALFSIAILCTVQE